MSKKFKLIPTTYYVYAVLVLLFLILVLVLLLRDSSLASIEVGFSDTRISSKEQTFLEVRIENTGDSQLIGTFNVSVDDPTNVNITIDQERLSVNLLPGESVDRRVPITATSLNYRSDYEFTVSLYSNNTLVDKNTAILSVRR